jgi:glycosyltransferase involved in cell wall biosynthesis
MSVPELSVILCTHNPRRDYLQRTIEGLRNQDLPSNRWELVLVDNASDPPVQTHWEILDAFNYRVVNEPQPGLTRARLAGFSASTADLIVMVDDDNVLEPDYLSTALSIARRWQILGTWGGQCFPEFEQPPDEWTRQFWPWIAIRKFAGDYWSNLPSDTWFLPVGAGMCVRRAVAVEFARQIHLRPETSSLGRTGSDLLGSEDHFLCRVACTLGLGNGLFSSLGLLHLIPPRRLTEQYLLKLMEGSAYSRAFLAYLSGEYVNSCPSRSQRLLRSYERLKLPARERRFADARARGAERARRAIEKLEHEKCGGSSMVEVGRRTSEHA